MSKKKIIIVLVLVLVIFAVYSDQKFKPKNINELRSIVNSQVGIIPTKAFTTDSCSLWLNDFIGNDFTDICIEHDMKYWKGGSAEDRKDADIKLRESINREVPFMGDIMYAVVRVFGHPLIPAPWRWGYGFEYPYRY